MLFENILHEFSWETIREASKTPINIAVQHFEQTNIYRDILLPRLGKNMSMALQNMTESQSSFTSFKFLGPTSPVIYLLTFVILFNFWTFIFSHSMPVTENQPVLGFGA